MELCRFFCRLLGYKSCIPPLRNVCNRFLNVEVDITTTAGEIVIFVVEVGNGFVKGIDSSNHIVLIPYTAVLAIRPAS